MLKSFRLLARRPGVSEDQFHLHWSTVHLELALKISALQRYVQFHPRSGQHVAGFVAGDVDGIPEIWWDDFGQLLALATDPEYTLNAGPDEANFMDQSVRRGVYAIERVRIAGEDFFNEPPPPVKVALLIAGHNDATTSELSDFIDQTWSAEVAEVPGLIRHVDSVARHSMGTPPSDYELITELWFAGADDVGHAARAFEHLAQYLDRSPFDRARSASLVGTELRAVWPEGL